ncbi:MAG: DNA cytosine methyltransferase [Atopostipes suicloacalis]|nr:DNA cytosine methyltransferase [Atopostipes suicloacalis]
MNEYTILETFVGAGGAHIGFKENGFISRYVNDIEETTIKTLLYNNPEIKETAYIDQRDILTIKGEEILEKTGLQQGEADVFFSGIVCKGFSLAGQRSPNDERNYFYHKQLEFVDVVQPKISIIENVPGILNATVLSPETPIEIKNRIDSLWKELENYKGRKSSLRKQGEIPEEFELKGKELTKERDFLLKYIKDNDYLISVIDDIKNLYKKMGDKAKIKKLNSAWYGASTRRERIIIVAVRNDIGIEFKYPKPTHYSKAISANFRGQKDNLKKYLPEKTVNDALNKIDYTKEDDLDNKPMNHREKTIRRFKYIPEGKNVVDVLDELPDELKVSAFYSRGSTMRLDGNKSSPTLVPGHSNFPIHPRKHRSITVREAAVITGFPLDYKFFGNHSKRCEHVGNAVPIELSNALARSSRELLDKYYSQKSSNNAIFSLSKE